MSDYSVDFLVERIYDILSKNKEIAKNSKLVVDNPDVACANRKTFFKNFERICISLKRSKLEVQRFYENELSAKTSIDSNGMLIINGMFRAKGIKRVLTSYLVHYVICKECGSNDTSLMKENRIL